MAFEDGYDIYRDVIASVIETLRPHVEVTTARLETLEAELARLEPQMVICGRSETADPPNDRLAWVEIPMDPVRPAKIYLGGRTSESHGPTLETLLKIIDEVSKLANPERYLKNG